MGQTDSVSLLDNGKAVIVRSNFLTLATDGASKEIRSCDSTAQADTALSDPQGKPTDANVIPYFILPWCSGAADKAKCKANPPYRQPGLQKGDFAVVISGDKLASAIAADAGPEGLKSISVKTPSNCTGNWGMKLLEMFEKSEMRQK